MIHCAHRAISYSVNVTVTHPYGSARPAMRSIKNISTYIPPSVSNRNFATAQGQPRPHLIPDLCRQCCNESWWNSLKRAVRQMSSRKCNVTQFARLVRARVLSFLDFSPKIFPLDARDTPRSINKASSARNISLVLLVRNLAFLASFDPVASLFLMSLRVSLSISLSPASPALSRRLVCRK